MTKHFEQYKDLLELQSLENQILKFENNIKDHNKRIIFVESKKQEAINDLSDLNLTLEQTKKDLGQKEDKLNQLQNNLIRNKEKMDMVKTTKEMEFLEAEVKSINDSIPVCEDLVFNLLENIETLEKNIGEKQSFLAGIDQSIEEVRTEVNIDIEKENKELKYYQERKSHLLDSFEKTFKDMFIFTYNKLRLKTFISILNGNRCGYCKNGVPANTCEQIEKAFLIELCPTCERILIPDSATK